MSDDNENKPNNLNEGHRILDSEKTFETSWNEFATKFKEKMDYEKMDNAYKKKNQK